MSRLFGPIRQGGYLVNDLEAAIDHWTGTLGVGPFFLLPDVAMVDPVYRGGPCEARIDIALANSGELQIELVQQTNDAPSIYREWLHQGRLGLHHVGFFVEDIDACLTGLDPAPERLQHGRNFCYIDTEAHPGTISELIVVDENLGGLFDVIRAASVSWDGTEPVRRLG
jgi:catechol 2,3-dioxygenase-like lactoylglutathione lyase family enzyme